MQKILFLVITSGWIGLSGCGGFSLQMQENHRRFHPSLHQNDQASSFSFKDHHPLSPNEPSAPIPESNLQNQEESPKALFSVAFDPKAGEEETLFLAGEKGPFLSRVDPMSFLSIAEEEEKDIPAAATSIPATEKEAPWARINISPPGNSALFESIPEGPADVEISTPEEKTSFQVPHAQAEDFLPSSPDALLPPLPLANVVDPPTIRQDPPSTPIAIFPSELNEKVGEFITYFQERAESFFSRALARSQAYEEMMKKIFREKDLPEELFYLALIESGYNPHATSRARAGGIWQFLTRTAKRFGLRVDKWVDERRDPEKSTYAAAEYLKSLYGIFNCWDLATAGYNAGEGKVLRAIKRANSQDFWEISRYRYLKQETKRYVPMFLAAVIIAKEPLKYGFSNIPYHPPLVYEKVVVPPETNLDWVAKVSEIEPSALRALNPSLSRGKTPPGSHPFEIKLPLGKKEIFEKKQLAYKQSAAVSGKRHTVRSGETLGSIANKYRIKCQVLCELNDLSTQSMIKPGMTLLLPP